MPLWFPPLIEMLIAMSIVVHGAGKHRRWRHRAAAVDDHFWVRSRFMVRLLVCPAADDLQFAGSHLLASLLSFNIGVELGQLLVLALMIPALSCSFVTS